MRIRTMLPGDAGAAAEIEKETFSQPWSRQGFLDSLANPDALFVIAEDDCGGAPVIAGYAGMYLAMDEGEITNVAVAAPFRRRGIGRALVEALAARGVSRGISRIILEVRVGNQPAIRLYEQLGFHRIGTRRGFYDFPKEDADIMLLETEKKE